MLKKERAAFILETLHKLYPETPVPLDNKDNYTLLIAVLLSAQCTDERVNKVTPALFQLADNPFDMQHVPIDEIYHCLLYTSPSPRDGLLSRMPSSA